MTVMLLQRSGALQLTHNQDKSDKNNSNEPPFLILLNIQEHAERERATSDYGIYNNNNNINNTTAGNKTDSRNIAIIGSNNTCKSALVCGARSAWNKSSRGRGSLATGSIAMQYYRLWIYACNLVLLGSAVGFAAAVSHTLLFSGDPRRYLVPGVPRPYDPTALYAYLAIAVQLGLVQLLGCIAAHRLSTKLLNAYWLLLLALLFGDAVIGVAWIFRFERMRNDLRPSLRLRLQVEYSKELRFSEQWDQLQHEFSCCGVTGPLDFESRWPPSCCPSKDTYYISSLEIGLNDDINNVSNSRSSNLTLAEPCQNPHTQGCEDQLVHWLRKTADLLFVLGFCVIAFSKLCFLGILRYEIREMIQKIRLLRDSPSLTVPFTQSFCQRQLPPQQSQLQQFQQQSLLEIPITRRTTLPTIAAHTTSGTISIFTQADGCTNSNHPFLTSNLHDGGADSDTNSHCALILEESTLPMQHHSTVISREKNHTNNNYEMREFNRQLLFSNGNTSIMEAADNSSNVPQSIQATSCNRTLRQT